MLPNQQDPAHVRVCVQVMEAHGAYLKRILKGTLLSRKVKLLQQLNSIINVGHRFGETTRRLEEKTALDPVPLEDPATGARSCATLRYPAVRHTINASADSEAESPQQ